MNNTSKHWVYTEIHAVSRNFHGNDNYWADIYEEESVLFFDDFFCIVQRY